MSDENKNLSLWERVQKTDPKYTKNVDKIKNGVVVHRSTAIAAQYQIRNATAEWGPYGAKWGFKNTEVDFDHVSVSGLVMYKATFFCPESEFEIRNSYPMLVGKSRYADKDFMKKMETDTLTKALSKLGFNADVFMGEFEDESYLEERRAEAELEASEDREEALKEKFAEIKSEIKVMIDSFPKYPTLATLESFKNKTLEKARKQLQTYKFNPNSLDKRIEESYEKCKSNLQNPNNANK